MGSAPEPSGGSVEDRFRQRLARVVAAVTVVFSVAAALRYLSVGVPALAAVAFGTAGTVGLGAFGLRRRPILFGHLLTSSLLAVLIVDNSVTGGFYDPNFGWLYIVPVLAGALLPGWSVVGYTAAVAVVTVAFFGLDHYGAGVADLVPPADHPGQSLFNRLAVMAGLVALVAAFSYARSRAARALASAVDEANAANRAKSDFLANMSHELRTPLTAIIGLSELVTEEVADGDDQDAVLTDLDRIGSAARGLLSLINDLLDLSKVEAGKLQIVAARTDVGKLLDELAATLEPLVRRGGNTWVVDLGDDLGNAWVDGPRLAQIVTNLVGNAAKFTRDGRVGLTVRREGRRLRLDVWDSGIGIPVEAQPRLFDSFVQVDPSTTRRYGGTGLGLAISRRLARLMGGDITLDSAAGEGARFTVWVDVAAPVQPVDVGGAAVSAGPGA